MSEDGGHWYTRAGEPAYTVPTKDGGQRPVNLRWDRHRKLVPSVTTVLSVIAKPTLTNWLVDQGILAALTLPRNPDWTTEDYLRAIRADGRQHAADAADRGTMIHDQLESDRTGAWPVMEEWKPTCQKVRELIEEAYPGVNDWIAEKPFGHPMGFGGKVDLHSPSTGIVLDYKTKAQADLDAGKQLAYDQHWQLAAYNRGLNLPPAECGNIFVSRDKPGVAVLHKWTKDEVDQGWRVFAAALELWKEVKGYDPSWQGQ